MKNYVLSLLLSILLPCALTAQVMQRGRTVEYNRQYKKTLYDKPVELAFEGAGTVNNQASSQKGTFVLNFSKLHPGEKTPKYDILIGDQKYVLFNKSKINEWNLSASEVLDVVVCKKEIVDYIEKTYTQNHVNQLNLRYDKARQEIEKQKKQLENTEMERDALQQQMNALELRLIRLQREYEEELKLIKERAVLFAYVDEERLDSLELKRRACVLNNDLVGAIEIGEQMNLPEVSKALIENWNQSHSINVNDRSELLDNSMILEDHIQNCILQGFDEDSLQHYYNILINIYKTLLIAYEDSKSGEAIYQSVKEKYGNLLCRMADSSNCGSEERDSLLLTAAGLDNSNALYYIVYYNHSILNDLVDSKTHRDYAKRLLDNVISGRYQLPFFSFIDEELVTVDIDEIQEMYESFPDFVDETDNVFFFYHIIGDNAVSLIDFIKKDDHQMKIKVPEKVFHDGQWYILKKIGQYAFEMDSYGDKPAGRHVDSLYCKQYGLHFYEPQHEDYLYRVFHDIKLPNTIEYFGTGAFDQRMNDNLSVNFPKNLKVIKDVSLTSVNYKNNIVRLPDGVEEVGDAWWGPDGPTLTIFIPSSVKKITAFNRLHKYSPPVRIKLDKNNKHFVMINDIMYTADSTEVYIGTANHDHAYLENWKYKQVLYIPANLKTDIDKLLQTAYTPGQIRDLVDSIYAEPGNPLYATKDGVLYDKQFKRLIWKPMGIKEMELPSTLTEFSMDEFDNVERVTLPKELPPQISATFFAYYDWIKINYLGMERERCFDNHYKLSFMNQLMEKHPEERVLPYVKTLVALGIKDYRSAYDTLENTYWADSSQKATITDSLNSIKREYDALCERYNDSSNLNEDEYSTIINYYSNMMDYSSYDQVEKLVVLLNERSLIRFSNNSYDEVVDDLKEAIRLMKSINAPAEKISTLYYNLGYAYYLSNKYLSAYNVLNNNDWIISPEKSEFSEILTSKTLRVQSLLNDIINDTMTDYDDVYSECNEIENYYNDMQKSLGGEEKAMLQKFYIFVGNGVYDNESFYESIEYYMKALELTDSHNINTPIVSSLFDKLDKVLADAIKNDQDNPILYQDVGILSLKRGDVKEAQQMLNKVYELDDEYAKDCLLELELKKYETRN